VDDNGDSLAVTWDEKRKEYIFYVRAGTQSARFEIKPRTPFITYLAGNAVKIIRGAACKFVDLDGYRLLYHGTTYPPL